MMWPPKTSLQTKTKIKLWFYLNHSELERLKRQWKHFWDFVKEQLYANASQEKQSYGCAYTVCTPPD